MTMKAKIFRNDILSLAIGIFNEQYVPVYILTLVPDAIEKFHYP